MGGGSLPPVLAEGNTEVSPPFEAVNEGATDGARCPVCAQMIGDHVLSARNCCVKCLMENLRLDEIGGHQESTNLYSQDFLSLASTFMANSQMKVIAELNHEYPPNLSGIISSIEFDREEELLAVAGTSRKIKVFNFSSVMNGLADGHYPVAEISSSSKLSCLSWSKSTKSQIACSDYEGTVTIYDVTTFQSVKHFQEHEKRVWSIDFSLTEPSMLVSGSDDCKVKIWSTKQEGSVLNIELAANICSVKYSPDSCTYLAVGSADHCIYYYDLRNISQPLHLFRGHRKPVSHVKFSSASDLISTSTDSTLQLWDVKNCKPVRTFKGHTNVKNFVGLSVNSDFITCGSETNEVVVYHKALPRPIAWHDFPCSNSDDAEEGKNAGSHFVSSVCWKGDSSIMVAANSQGIIRVLSLAA